jgi:hypothetical protein
VGVGTGSCPRIITHDRVSYEYRQWATDKGDNTAAMTAGAVSKEQDTTLRVIVYYTTKGNTCIFSFHVDTFADCGFQLQE